MNQIWAGLIVIAFLVMVGFLISLIIELKKTARALREWLKTTEELTRPTFEELQQSLKSVRDVSDDINTVTTDIKTFSGALKDTGQNIKTLSTLLEQVTSSTLIKASGLRAGIRTALEVLLSNIFLKKGDRQ